MTVVVGGGLAGLASAVLLARAGRSVMLFEKARVGGRATTAEHAGVRFNQGPHALYRGGRGMQLLTSLGVAPRGGIPSVSGSYAWNAGRLHALPVGAASLLTTSLLTLPEKLELARVLAGLRRTRGDALEAITVEGWLSRVVRHERCRAVIRAMLRVATYANHPDRMSIGAALRQLRLALDGNVVYLDGGWQTLVDALRARAIEAGVTIVEHARVVGVRSAGGCVAAVELAPRVPARGAQQGAGPGGTLPADEVLLAVSPGAAVELTGSAALARWAERLVPIRAASLDLALSRLPRPRRTFALGIDRPLYFSVHSRSARLASGGVHVLHAAKYLSETNRGGDAREELEALIDALQPGWRDAVVARRFVPELTVAHAVPPVGGRPPIEAAGIAGLVIAGDWVGPEGMLADAALASAEDACRFLLGPAMKSAA